MEERAQLRELSVGRVEAFGQRDELGGDTVRRHLARVARDLAEAPLDPRALGVERERLCVAVRKRRSIVSRLGAPAPVSGILSSSPISSRSGGMTLDYPAAGREPEWAARPIFQSRTTHRT